MKPDRDTTLEQAFSRLDQALAGARLPDEAIATTTASGRVLAESTHSVLDLPPFDKAAMDGYAVPAGVDTDRYRVVGAVLAGQPPPAAPLGPGEAMRIMTGAAVPPGSAEVVMQEDVLVEGSTVRVCRRRGRNICPRGEDVRSGDLVLPAGHRIRPLDVANLLACGVSEVRVVRRPRVAIVTTGNELCDDPKSLRPGQIMNSNGPLLCQLSKAHGLEVVAHAHAADDVEQICLVLEQALASADIAVVTGGVSVGDFDLVPEAFDALGLERHVARMAVKPGRPTMVATRGCQPVFGLPGNPVAAYLMFHLLVLRAAARLTGSSPPVRVFSLESGSAFERRSADRMEFLPARLTEDGQVTCLEFHGSAHLSALTRADGFAVMPPGTRVVGAGERVSFWTLESLTS